MKSSRNYPAMQIKVGTLVAVALLVALLAMIFPTKGVNPFSAKMKLVSYFPAVAGLRESSPVWFAGVEIGSVTYVDFERGSNPPRLKVIMEIERKIQPYIRTDAKASIKGMGLLGDMYVDLSPGTAPESVASGAEIEGIPIKEMKDDLDAMMASAKGLLKNLEEVSADLAEGRGALGQLLKDPTLYPQLRDTVTDLRRFAASMNEPNGTTHKLMTDPALYNELLAAVQDIRSVVADLKQTEQKVLSPETRQALDDTVKVASRVVKRVGEYQEKIDKIRFDLDFGLSKYEANVSAGNAHLYIWPNEQRYYMVGIQKASQLYGNETEETTYEAQLAWRILDSPVFIRGGVTRSDYFDAGLDLRLFHDNFKVLVDAYRVDYNPVQLDVRTGVVFLDLIELTAGVEDMAHRPFYKAGLTIHYRDDDLLNVIFKTKF
jgi:phospholipid/cholesterol/gamma-HCH transport system substrate-binding protein